MVLQLFTNSENYSIRCPWHARCPRTDTCQVNLPDVLIKDKITKGIILATAASIFDPPFGLIAPITSTAKLFLHDLLRTKSSWDKPLPLLQKKSGLN